MKATLLFVLLPGVFLLLACGSEPEPTPQSSPQHCFDAAMKAVAAADLDALWPLLTETAREGLRHELQTWQERFKDPEEGLFLREQIRGKRPGLVGEDEFEQAAQGSLRDVFRFMLKADPRPAAPKQRSLSVSPDGKTVRIRYDSPSGDQTKEVETVFVRRPGGWFLASLQL